MPIIQVTLIEGRPAEAKERLIKALSEATAAAIDAPLNSIRVILQEVPAAHWGVGGASKACSDLVGESAHG
jgi:4-oxalocrotonate tautomerase